MPEQSAELTEIYQQTDLMMDEFNKEFQATDLQRDMATLKLLELENRCYGHVSNHFGKKYLIAMMKSVEQPLMSLANLMQQLGKKYLPNKYFSTEFANLIYMHT